MREKLKQMILDGNSRFNTDRVAIYIGADEKLFAELIYLMHNSPAPIPLRSSWIMSVVTDNYPWLVNPYFRILIDNLPSYNHTGIVRNVLRLFSLIEVPEEYAGEIYNLSCDFFVNAKMPIAVRVNAMQILYNIALKEPDLRNELILLLEDNLEGVSAGVISRANKLIGLLSKK
jgi:hypothetical protein